MIEFVVKLGILAVAISIVGRIVSSLFAGFFGMFFTGFLSTIGIMVAAVILIVKAVSGGSKKSASRRKSPRFSKLGEYMSENELRETDLSLREFFRMNDRLVIKDHLYLRPRDGVYRGIDQLELWYHDEAVATVAGLSEEHTEKCYEIMDFIKGSKPRARESAASTLKAERDRQKTRAQEYISNIDAVNAGISDDLITASLNRTVQLLGVTHQMELKMPESDKLRKLYDHYLPILMSTLIKFMNLGEKAPLSRDYIDTKSKLAETVDLINEALVNITSDFYGGEMSDINIDAKTLQSILKKDGVVGGGMIFPERLDEIVEDEEKEGIVLEVLEK